MLLAGLRVSGPAASGLSVHCTIWLYRLQHHPHPKPPCDTCDIIYICASFSVPMWLVHSL